MSELPTGIEDLNDGSTSVRLHYLYRRANGHWHLCAPRTATAGSAPSRMFLSRVRRPIEYMTCSCSIFGEITYWLASQFHAEWTKNFESDFLVLAGVPTAAITRPSKRSKNRTQYQDSNECDDATDDYGHHHVEVAFTVSQATNLQ